MSVCIRYYQIALLKNQFILITKGVKEEEDLLGCLNRKKKKKIVSKWSCQSSGLLL